MSTPERFCVLLKDGNYVFGFNPETQQTLVTHLMPLAFAFLSYGAAEQWLRIRGNAENGLSPDLVQGIVPLIGEPDIQLA